MRIPEGTRLHQISDDDLETCEEALKELKHLVANAGTSSQKEHFIMMEAAIKRVRDDYGPHTNVRIIPA